MVNYYCVARSTTLYKTFSIVTRANKQLIGKEKGLHNSVTFKRSAHYKLTIYSHAICGQQLTVNVFTLYRIYVTGLHVVTFNTCSIFWSSSGKWGERKREIRDIQQKIMVRMLPSVQPQSTKCETDTRHFTNSHYAVGLVNTNWLQATWTRGIKAERNSFYI